MSRRVRVHDIERIVGVARHPTRHYARAVSAAEVVYVLHSQECLNSVPDLRNCPYSRALDNGIDMAEWDAVTDRPVHVAIDRSNWLTPVVEP